MALNNRMTRILVAIIAIPLIVFISYYGRLPFYLMILFIGLTAFYEFSKMSFNKSVFVNIPVGLISVFFIITNSYIDVLNFKHLSLMIIVILLLNELFRNNKSAINNLGATLIGIFYIGLFAGTIIGIREFFGLTTGNYQHGGILIISIFATIWICDSAAYFLGSAFGKHKLFPRVSPNKSWEGAIAGFIFAVITMILVKLWALNILSWQDAVVIGIIIGTIGQLGDLVESLIKRDAGVKDSSNIIPGHGGIFDRFDSLLMSSPVIYLYLVYFVK